MRPPQARILSRSLAGRCPCNCRHGLSLAALILNAVVLFLSISRANASPSSRSSLYDVLGVSKSCSGSDLKKAYRKQCLEHHPDKGGNEDKFKEIQKAYDILSDDEKRKVYDQFGEEAALNGNSMNFNPNAAGFNFGNGGPQPGGQGMPNFFSFSTNSNGQGQPGGGFQSFQGFPGSMGGGGGRGFGGGGGGINLEELFMGSTGAGTTSRGPGGINLDFSDIIRQMQQGQQPGQRGPNTNYAEPKPSQPVTRDCPCSLEDLATGTTKKLKVSFAKDKSRIYNIPLKKGWKPGTKVKFEASKTKSKTTGVIGWIPPITFVIREKKHPYLQRRGDDLVYRCNIDRGIGTATSPGSGNDNPTTHPVDDTTDADNNNHNQTTIRIEVVLPNGEAWSRTLPRTSSFVRHGQSLTITGKGMPIKGGPQRGNLIIEFYSHTNSTGTSTGSTTNANTKNADEKSKEAPSYRKRKESTSSKAKQKHS